MADVTPLLANVVVPGNAAPAPADQLAVLNDADVDFIASETGNPRDQIALLVGASALQRSTASPTTPSGAIPAEVFYGLAREGLPLNLAALATRTASERNDALTRAIADGIVPAALRDTMTGALAQLQQIAVTAALRLAPDGGHAVGDLLASTLPSADQQAALLAAAVEHTGDPGAFWKALRTNPSFQAAGVVDRLQLTLQLALVTGNHLPLVRQLQQTSGISSPRDLVAFSTQQWTALLQTPVNGAPIGVPPGTPGATPAEQTSNYVNAMMGTLQAAFPTTAVAQHVLTAPGIGIEGAARDAVARFFTNAADFDIRSTRVSDYIAQHGDQAFAGIDAGTRGAVVSQVQRLQRAFLVSTSADTMTALLAAGLDSAHAVASIPRASFLARYAGSLGGADAASAVYDRAVAIEHRTLHVYATVNDALTGANPAALQIGPEQIEAAVGKYIPNYSQLFGLLDLCDCDDCRSVLSPAAYFVDLLEFLRHSTPNAQKQTPLDVLLARRPDSAALPLTCENTNTTLPYVDLVNEVLESYIVLGKPSVSAAHDTDDTSARELDANPQFTLDKAYESLDAASYPFALPFHQPLEVSRTYLQHLGTSRWELMRAFLKTPSAMGDRAASAERLAMSPEAYRVITGADLDPSVTVAATPVREQFGYDTDQVTRTVNNKPVTQTWTDWLAGVPELLQRTGLAYEELVSLVETRFINPAYPQGAALAFFDALPISFSALTALVQANFANPPQDVADALAGANITIQQLQSWSGTNYAGLTKLVVLDAPDAAGDLTTTRLVHLDGTLLIDSELDRLHRFVRLWRIVGWTIPELDAAVASLGSDITPDLIAALATMSQLRELITLPKIATLLALFAPIDTRGSGTGARDTLYATLFLSKATLAVDTAFLPDPASGAVLVDAKVPIDDHVPALLKALRVSAADLAAIRAATTLDAANAPLTLANVSMLFRHAAFARALGLRITDLLSLRVLAGLDPFSSPANALAFVQLARRVQQSGFTVAQLDYLCRGRTAPPTNLGPQPTTVRLLARALRDGLLDIARDTTPAPDPAGDLSRTNLALLLDASTVDAVIAMINGTAIYSVPLAALPAQMVFPPTLAKKISFDPAAKSLSFTGAMSIAEQSTLIGASSDKPYQAAVTALAAAPAAVVRDALGGFMDVTDAQKTLLGTASLDPDLQPVLLDAKGNPTKDPNTAVTTAIAAKFAYLLDHLLPFLRDRLSRTLVKQSMSSALRLDASTTQVLLESVLQSQADPKTPAIADLLALEAGGASAEYYASTNLTGNPSLATTPATIAIPNGIGSARWRAMLEPPAGGDFVFAVSGGGSVQLWVGDDAQPLPLTLDTSTQAMKSGPIALAAGALVPIRLEVTQLPANTTVELTWQAAPALSGAIPAGALVPGVTMDNAIATFTRLQKSAMVAGTFGLSDRELAHFAAHSADFGAFDLNALPLSPDDSGAPKAFAAWARIAAYVALRNGLPAGEVALIDVFAAASVDDAKGLLAQATGWDATILGDLVSGFALAAPAFVNEIWPARLADAVRLVKRIGASPAQLFSWSAATTDYAALRATAQDVKAAARARHDDESWLSVAKPLADHVREAQRDALVAFLLPRLGLDDANQLLATFLIDAEMGACMETSRIKQAISSVQLFVQRALMNLEPDVSPSKIDEQQWTWMQRYRVWEANREVFLWPENWIKPELRDDKSPFFTAFENTLRQSDTTSDSAESALDDYLQCSRGGRAPRDLRPLVAGRRSPEWRAGERAARHRPNGEHSARLLLPAAAGRHDVEALGTRATRHRRRFGHADRLERPHIPVLADDVERGRVERRGSVQDGARLERVSRAALVAQAGEQRRSGDAGLHDPQPVPTASGRDARHAGDGIRAVGRARVRQVGAQHGCSHHRWPHGAADGQRDGEARRRHGDGERDFGSDSIQKFHERTVR